MLVTKCLALHRQWKKLNSGISTDLKGASICAHTIYIVSCNIYIYMLYYIVVMLGVESSCQALPKDELKPQDIVRVGQKFRVYPNSEAAVVVLAETNVP